MSMTVFFWHKKNFYIVDLNFLCLMELHLKEMVTLLHEYSLYGKLFGMIRNAIKLIQLSRKGDIYKLSKSQHYIWS